MKWYVTTFYYFLPLKQLVHHKLAWEIKAQELGVEGLLILGPEGFNTTCCAPSQENLEAFKNWVVTRYPASQGMLFKDSVSHIRPFKRYKVKIRPEIVTLHAPDLVPDNKPHKHLSPSEWNEVLKHDPEAIVIDTRNWYEYQIGTFERAINPNIQKFTEFPEWFEKQGIKKDQKILIFCTGGIRCEKGIYELERMGYHNVYQLEGGIINYIAKFPNDQFKGECFVFDRRVALDQNLQPSSRYALCPHCGQPADVHKKCKRCGSEYIVCPTCDSELERADLCSKNCVYQYHYLQQHV
jgi:UPF0176 protein